MFIELKTCNVLYKKNPHKAHAQKVFDSQQMYSGSNGVEIPNDTVVHWILLEIHSYTCIDVVTSSA